MIGHKTAKTCEKDLVAFLDIVSQPKFFVHRRAIKAIQCGITALRVYSRIPEDVLRQYENGWHEAFEETGAEGK